VDTRVAAFFGFINALPSQMGTSYTAAEEAVGRHHGLDAASVSSLGGAVSWASTVFGLILMPFGGRLTATMWPYVIASTIGLVGVVVFGFGAGTGGFIASLLMTFLWDALSPLLRARYEDRYPILDELRAERAGQFQTGFKAGQMLPIQLLLVGYQTIGVGPTSMIAAAVAAVLVIVATVYVNRGAEPVGAAAESPALRESAHRMAALIRSTYGGVARLLFSVPVGTVLTGLPVYALAGGMVGTAVELSLLGGGGNLWLIGSLTVATGVSLLTFAPRFTAVVTGLQWARLHKALGGSADEAGVLVRLFFLTSVALVAVAAWGSSALGFVPLAMLMIVAATSSGWERTPLDVWIPTGAGKILFNSAKGAAVSLGQQLGAFTFGAAALAANAAFDAGASPEMVHALKSNAFMWLFVLAVGIAVAKMVWVIGFRAFHIAPIGDLLKYLPEDRGPPIIGALKKAGYGTVGVAYAVFLLAARRGRTAMQARLRDVLTADDRALLEDALRAYFAAPRPRLIPSAGLLARVRAAASRAWGTLRSRLTGAGSAHGPPWIVRLLARVWDALVFGMHLAVAWARDLGWRVIGPVRAWVGDQAAG
ncbi:MAG: hypothetical protein ACRDQ0_16305, partial [Pseudonocardia sp.]